MVNLMSNNSDTFVVVCVDTAGDLGVIETTLLCSVIRVFSDRAV